MSTDDRHPGLSILDDGEDQAPQRPKPRRRRRGILILVAVLAVFLVVPIAVVSIYAVNIESTFTGNVNREPGLTIPSEPNRPEKPAEGEKGAGSVNFLLMGSDDRDDGNGGRSDALMLVHLTADRDGAYIISFPRDLYVDIPGRGKNKINAAYAFGGPVLSARTVEDLLDVHIDHLAQIDMEGFINLTTELGGVTVNNKHYSKSGKYEFPTGEITISGEEALAYVRERKQLPRGDLDRAERQRQVVQAIMRKGLSPGVISNPTTFTNFVAAAARNMTVDDRLTDQEIRKLALGLRMTPNDVVTLEVPTKGTGTAGSMSIVVPDEAGIATLATHVREDTLSDYNP
ncbi:LCP family protein [Propionibacteriaceae bacterium Y2011]|uniref:LCP family protein n=1 Tax=Microlunatus sp. Y2014 TaxID=3418488 RepID=UPI003B45A478